jgi:hypothetical protein
MVRPVDDASSLQRRSNIFILMQKVNSYAHAGFDVVILAKVVNNG